MFLGGIFSICSNKGNHKISITGFIAFGESRPASVAFYCNVSLDGGEMDGLMVEWMNMMRCIHPFYVGVGLDL